MSKRSEDALIALRKIQRMTEMSSKRLARTAGLTPSQLSVLRILAEYDEVSAGWLAEATQLKHATITSLIDKLEERKMIARRKCDEDRRRVWHTLLPAGKAALTEYTTRNETIIEEQHRYNNACSEGKNQTIYKFNSGVMTGDNLKIDQTAINLKNDSPDISLIVPHRFSDMCD